MNVIRAIATELLGLFVEDWAFAIAIAVWIGLVAVHAAFRPADVVTRAYLLTAGLGVILLASVYRASRKV